MNEIIMIFNEIKNFVGLFDGFCLIPKKLDDDKVVIDLVYEKDLSFIYEINICNDYECDYSEIMFCGKEYKDGNYYYCGMNIEQPIELYIKEKQTWEYDVRYELFNKFQHCLMEAQIIMINKNYNDEQETSTKYFKNIFKGLSC